ncbi:efflux RND transporter periplasmic adaptor subunit [Fundidesulfovibrio agrisoli]|uniref:efflux RND transporter periplasmic adaptor subunit n=1 Tax=Fundidesulfovibrio agrisoli TaxID=2922717 RepID=UPI001FADD9B2|nr:efflux RND transporter periplasmic adaptor subunit [Fundidesulfovibrio agrisoli]
MKSDLESLRITRDAEGAPAAGARRWRPGAKTWFAALALLALALWWFVPRTTQVETVQAVLVHPTRALTLVNATGYVVADRKAAVASKITSRLVWLGVEEGSRVRKGDVIARLEGEDVAAALKQAEADLAAARFMVDETRAELDDATLNHDRFRELDKRKVVARSEYDQAVARYRKAQAAHENAVRMVAARKAALELAKANLEYTVVRAPFDAVVLTKSADVGDIVTPLSASATSKASVVTLADLGSLQIEADVSESNLAKVRQGQPVEIMLDAYGEERFPGHVHMIVPTADKAKATVMVKVRFDELDQRVLPQMSAKVAFLERAPTPQEQTPRLAVPLRALTGPESARAVFLAKDGKARLTPVNLGMKLGDMVEITSGLSAGDKVVLSPPDTLKDGGRVEAAGK